jgi:hypothetical protein
MNFLQSSEPSINQELKNGAFNCIQAMVCKGINHAQKIEII